MPVTGKLLGLRRPVPHQFVARTLRVPNASLLRMTHEVLDVVSSDGAGLIALDRTGRSLASSQSINSSSTAAARHFLPAVSIFQRIFQEFFQSTDNINKIYLYHIKLLGRIFTLLCPADTLHDFCTNLLSPLWLSNRIPGTTIIFNISSSVTGQLR